MSKMLMRTTGLLLALLLGGLAASRASVARAQDDARTAAASHFKLGVDHAQRHEYAQALADFEAAYRLVQHASVLYNIALAQVGLGRNDAAVTTLRRYLAEPKGTQSATQRKAALVLLDELLASAKKTADDAALARVTATVQVQLTVVVFPYGKVWIDGQPVGDSPVTASVSVGAHRVSGGRADAEQALDVTLEAGAARRVVLAWARKDLVPSEPAAISVGVDSATRP
jgi:hypothetical protein